MRDQRQQRQQQPEPRFSIRYIAAYTGVFILLASMAVMAFIAVEKQARHEMLRDQAQAEARSSTEK